MLLIQCNTCGREATIKGTATPNTYEEPGEIIISDKEDFTGCCCCIQDGGEYTVIAFEPQTFDDDVIGQLNNS